MLTQAVTRWHTVHLAVITAARLYSLFSFPHWCWERLVWILSAQDLKEAHAQLTKDEFAHQSGQMHAYIEKTIEKKHGGMQKPVKICLHVWYFMMLQAVLFICC